MPAFVTPIELLLRLCLREASAKQGAPFICNKPIKHLIVKHDLV